MAGLAEARLSRFNVLTVARPSQKVLECTTCGTATLTSAPKAGAGMAAIPINAAHKIERSIRTLAPRIVLKRVRLV